MSHTKKKPWLGALAGLTSAAAVFALSLATPMVAVAGGNSGGGHDNGTYQLVWCHQTGNDWQAQLGSGSGNGRVALEMTDTIRNRHLDNIDNTVASGNQVEANDRSDQLDALCSDQATPEPPAPPAIPEPTVVTTYGDWTGDEPTCDNTEVTQTRTVTTTTTTYTWEWNEATSSYDKVAHEGTPVTGVPETRTVTYQGDDCAVTPQKALSGDAVVVSQTCDSVTFKYTDTREASDTESVLRSIYLDNDTSHLVKNFTLKGGESATVVFTDVESGTYEWGWFGGSSFDDATTQVVTRGSLDFDACQVTPPAVTPPVITFSDVCYDTALKTAKQFTVNIAVPNDGESYGVHFQYKDGAGVENGGFADDVKGPNFAVNLPFDGTTIAEGNFTFTSWLELGEQESEHAVKTVDIAACATTPPVVTPPAVTPPAVTPPAVVPPATHKTPTTVQTDGDMSLMVWLLVGLGGLGGLLFVANTTGVLAPRTRRQH